MSEKRKSSKADANSYHIDLKESKIKSGTQQWLKDVQKKVSQYLALLC